MCQKLNQLPKRLYIVGKGTTEPAYDPHSVSSDLNSIDAKLKEEGFEFTFEDDGGYHYSNGEQEAWVSYVYYDLEKGGN